MTRATSPAPTGTVTFLFTDIEGSTQRWESEPAAMDVAVKRHEALLRAAFLRHRGHVFKTVGDAFCVVFARASDAIVAAVDAQQSLCAQDFSAVGGLHVRMGLHVGEASERDGDYFGPSVNTVARLMSAGHGDQVLVSAMTRDLTFHHLPAGVTMRDLGLHRLKDLQEPLRVWQLSIEGLSVTFPPLRSLGSQSTNLPIARTRFIGRERDLTQIKGLLREHRLLTLAGTGGVGKTRLAVQAGAAMLDSYPDGVWFADFAPIGDKRLVPNVIAKVLGISERRGQQLGESIPRWLQRKNLLLILDNCEHVLDGAAAIADGILGAAPDVRLVATSRQSLGIGGEKVLRVATLDAPSEVTNITAAAAINFDAVTLFADRASLAEESFAVTDGNASIVAQICRRLDGIPLAIELAAARVGSLGPRSIAARLDERFKILTVGTRTALPRQKTLLALIDWSFDLLTSQEQAFFSRLGIFAGSFDLEAANAVCAPDGSDPSTVLDLLASLTAKSLVVAEIGAELERYRLLESTRAYALDKLTATERGQLARRHAEYFRERAESADKRYGPGSTTAWLAGVELDLDNYRAALKWAIGDANDVPLGAVVAGALEQLWFRGGLAGEGIDWIGGAQASLDESAHPLVAARMLRALAFLRDGKDRYDIGLRMLELYRSVGDEAGEAWALCFVAFGLQQIGRLEEAIDPYARAIEKMRRLGDRWGAGLVLIRQATLGRDRGEFATARELYAQGLAEMKALGNEASQAVALSDLAELEFADGDAQRAVSIVNEALEIDRSGKNATHLANEYNCRCVYRIALGNLDDAGSDAREGLRWARQSQNPLSIAIALQNFSLLAALRGEFNMAARLIGHVGERYKELGYEREVTEEWGYENITTALRERLSDSDQAKLATEGAAWSEDRAVEESLRL